MFNSLSMSPTKKNNRSLVHRKGVLIVLLMLLLSACQREVCPAGSLTYLSDSGSTSGGVSALVLPGESLLTAQPMLVEIGGKMRQVDRVITGPVCNDIWKGRVYVACDIQIAAWNEGEKPDFFKDCDLKIEPGTLVYVAAHNDTAYYNGCSCHMGGENN